MFVTVICNPKKIIVISAAIVMAVTAMATMHLVVEVIVVMMSPLLLS